MIAAAKASPAAHAAPRASAGGLLAGAGHADGTASSRAGLAAHKAALLHRWAAWPRGTLPLAAAWLLTLMVLGSFVVLAVTRRADIMRAWPPSERAYALAGLKPPRQAEHAEAAPPPR